jgi:hypothetical protein
MDKSRIQQKVDLLHNDGPWSRDGLVRNVPISEIPDLIHSEKIPVPEVINMLATKWTKETYTHDEIYGNQAFIALHVPVPVDIVFDYIANVYSFEEYTYSLRNFEHLGGGLYVGDDVVGGPNTKIYLRNEAYRDSGVVDCLSEWDCGDNLWMRYHMRVVDSMPTNRIPGTMLTMLNFKHPFYDRATKDVPEYIAKGRSRTDRPWVGDVWTHFFGAHSIELGNLKKILTARYQKYMNKR